MKEPTEEARAVLHELPLFRFLSPEIRKLVVDSFSAASFTFGEPIVTEGEAADAFYVLVSGTARVIKTGRNDDEISLTLLRPGDSFGEMGLLETTTRTATVRASAGSILVAPASLGSPRS